MCNEAVDIEPVSLAYVPDRFKTQEMCVDAVRRYTYTLYYVADHFKTQEICNEAMFNSPWALRPF